MIGDGRFRRRVRVRSVGDSGGGAGFGNGRSGAALELRLKANQHANCDARAPSDDDVWDEEDGLQFADLQHPPFRRLPDIWHFPALRKTICFK